LVSISLLRIGRQIVDGGEMEHMVDLAEALDGRGRDAAIGPGQITLDRLQAFDIDAPIFGEFRHALGRWVAHEKSDLGARPGQQFAHKPLADETGRSGHEISHGRSPPLSDPDPGRPFRARRL
jgi:hypothetical protein